MHSICDWILLLTWASLSSRSFAWLYLSTASRTPTDEWWWLLINWKLLRAPSSRRTLMKLHFTHTCPLLLATERTEIYSHPCAAVYFLPYWLHAVSTLFVERAGERFLPALICLQTLLKETLMRFCMKRRKSTKKVITSSVYRVLNVFLSD